MTCEWFDGLPKEAPGLARHFAGHPDPVHALRAVEDRSLGTSAGFRRFWAFGARAPEADAQVGDAEIFLELQPVVFIVAPAVVVTCRHPARRLWIAPHRDPDVGEPFDADLFAEALSRLDRPTPDLTVLTLVRTLVRSLFRARAELAQWKTVIDTEFFDGLLDLRREAAGGVRPSVHEVQANAGRAATLIDETRSRLAAIQRAVVEERDWFDGLKPSATTAEELWVPGTTETALAATVINDIYRVRNDLRALRHDVHDSMAVVASCDTGAQLLAVRALLDRTEAARRAGIIAATVSLLLAMIVLAVAVATVPAAGSRFSLTRSVAGTALLVLAALAVATVLAAATARAAGYARTRRPFLWTGIASAAVAASAFGGAFAVRSDQVLLLSVGGALGLAGLGSVIFAAEWDARPDRVEHASPS